MFMEPPPVPGYSIHQTPTGEFYYVNIETGESRWERPPPDHSQPPQSPMPTPSGQVLPVKLEPGPDLKFAKGAILLMFVSLFMPYITVGGIIEISGIEIISEAFEMGEAIMELDPDELAGTGGECPYANDGECDEPFLCEEGTDGDDCGTSDSGGGGGLDLDVPYRFYMILIGSIMVLISPFFIILSGILSSVTVFSGGKLPKILGSIHLAFFALLFLMLAIGGTVLDDLIGEVGTSLVEFMGFGLWVGGLSGIGLIYDNS